MPTYQLNKLHLPIFGYINKNKIFSVSTNVTYVDSA